MQLADFSGNAPGELVELGRGAHAFVPQDLPPILAPSWELMAAAEHAHAAISELVGQAKLIPNLELVLRAFARREAILSSKMEGTQTEIVEVLVQEALAGAPPDEDTDIHEVLNYLGTLDLARAWLSDGRILDLPMIRDLHARLLRGVRGATKSPGAFRTKNVFIGQRSGGFQAARFVPPPSEHVAGLMENLASFGKSTSIYGPLIDCAIAHYQFETIHPFEDGNGRLGRLLIPLQLITAGVLDRPILYLAPYFETHDDAYRDGLLAVSREGAWVPWILMFLEAIRATGVDARSRVDRVMKLQLDYRQRINESIRSRYAYPALDVVFENTVVTSRLLRDRLQTSAMTVKAIVDAFVGLGILTPLVRMRGMQLWVAQELREQVYES